MKISDGCSGGSARNTSTRCSGRGATSVTAGRRWDPVDSREAMLLSVLVTQEERIAAPEAELGLEHTYSREGERGQE